VRDPAELVEFLAQPDFGGAVLVEALDGFVDAGHGVRLAREHLLDSFEPQLVARFDVDELHDYRSRRPTIIFDDDHWESYERPSIDLHLLRDASRTPFLLLAGPEPDTQWERFVAALIVVIEQLNVSLTVGLQSIPWAVAHTRPIQITSHGQPRELLATPPHGIGKVQVPASIGHLLEYRLGAEGRPAVGLAAHTPYYLSQVEYPAAAEALLESLERTAGLSLSLAELRERGAEAQAGVDAQVADDEQVQSVIRELEKRSEAATEEGLMLQEETLPTGDELGAAFQRFLADRTRPAGHDAPQ
jgi:proteasome assembly chaperone (PAC2) family protein